MCVCMCVCVRVCAWRGGYVFARGDYFRQFYSHRFSKKENSYKSNQTAFVVIYLNTRFPYTVVRTRIS